MAYLDVESGRNIYYEHYRGVGAPVVLVHGLGMSLRCWDLTLPALLEEGHEVVAFDQRCCGRSDKDFDEVSTKSVASDLEKLIDVTGLQRPVVVGWSLGAAVVAEAAGRLRDRLAGIVLVGPTTPRLTQADGFPYGNTAEVMDQMLSALRDTRPEFLHTMSEAFFHADVGKNTIEWLWQMLMQSSPRVDAAARDLGVIDHRELLPTVRVPALVCTGAHDAIVDPAIAKACAQLLPNARLLEFAESGHAPFLDARERFNRELLAFVQDPAGSVATPSDISASIG